MKNLLNKQQRDFCKYYIETDDPIESALLAGYNDYDARHFSFNWVERPEFISYIDRLRKEHYSLKQHLKELNLVMELALKSENITVLIKIIELKGKLFGLDKFNPQDEEKYFKNLNKKDLFDRIKEKADVFEKLEKDNNSSDISDNNS